MPSLPANADAALPSNLAADARPNPRAGTEPVRGYVALAAHHVLAEVARLALALEALVISLPVEAHAIGKLQEVLAAPQLRLYAERDPRPLAVLPPALARIQDRERRNPEARR